MKFNKENVAFIILISAFVLYMVWHLGRWYGVNEAPKQFYKAGTLTEDAYNYYLLTKCLRGELKIERNPN